ncbi:MAG TPA: hypothetical protein VLJ37_12250 [bacterium]|nr:hypothetical protein [bacterium]
MMQRKFWGVLFLLCSAFILSSTAEAKSARDRFDFDSEPEVSIEIHSYDNQMIQAAQIAEINARKHSHRRCWRAVKNAMLEAAVLDERPTTRYAKQAGEELEKKFGFKRIDVSDPFAAPIGSVLVYGGRGAGHIEIRTEDGFVSDFISEHPSNRPLIGVYVRI